MKAAGVAWIFSKHVYNHQRTLGSGGVFDQPNFKTSITARMLKKVRCDRPSLIEKFESQRTTSVINSLFKSVVSTWCGLAPGIPSIAGQREVDQLVIEQRKAATEGNSKQRAGSWLNSEPDAVKRRLEDDEKIQRYKYTGH